MREYLRDTVDGFDDEFDTDFVGERTHEIELRSRWAVRSFNIGDGTVARNNA